MMWSQKYRPRQLSECVLDHLDDEDQSLLQHAVTAATLPTLLLYGPPGTGKTTIAGILCDDNRFDVSCINGSDFEKHDVPRLRETISTYSLFLKQKCIRLEEMDGVTLSAQRALRAMIDSAADVSWICTANDVKAIMEPLQSRAILINCSYGSEARREAHFAGVVRRCRVILSAEGIGGVSDEDLQHLVELHHPDIRQTINDLQRKYASSDDASLRGLFI